MKRVITLCLLLAVGAFAAAAQARPRPEIMGISLNMSRDDARARLKSLGRLEREERKRQEVWAVNDPRISHLLVGYDPDYRVRYITAVARAGGPRIRYEEIADLKRAQRLHHQGNYKFTWEVAARRDQFAYVTIAHGRDPQYLDSYSVKKVDGSERRRRDNKVARGKCDAQRSTPPLDDQQKPRKPGGTTDTLALISVGPPGLNFSNAIPGAARFALAPG